MKILSISKERNFESTRSITIRKLLPVVSVVICSALILTPLLAFGSVEGSLQAVQDKLVGTLLPLGAMCGLAVAGLSFVAGHPNARQHFFCAIIGAIVGFGAESIVNFIRNLIH